MAETLTVIIAARNCIDRIEGTVAPWKQIANEIIVVDQMSTDGTEKLATKLGCTVFQNDPKDGNFDYNRKLAMQRATTDWLLYIDTDERPTIALLNELKEFLKAPPQNVDGVKIPNQFYFMGAALKHGLYNPKSSEIRLVRQGKWHYPAENSFHTGVSVKGGIEHFKNPYKHFNVNGLTEWFQKTNQYTEHDAKVKIGNSFSLTLVLVSALKFFLRHYFYKKGYKDGVRGFVSVFYFMLYHMTLQFKIWEKQQLATLKKEEDYLTPFETPKR